jgi:iron complex outermembrane receptor protein
VGAAYRYYDNYYGIPGGFVGGHPGGVDIDMWRHAVRGEGERHREGSTWHRLHADASFVDYHHRELETSGAVGTAFDQVVGALELRADHERLGPFGEGAAGVRAQYRDIGTSGSLKTPSTYDWSLAAFLVEDARRGPLEVQAGMRFDWARYVPRDSATITVGGAVIPVMPRTFGSFSASLGALYETAPGVRLGASVSRAYRTPDFNELYSDGPHLAANSYEVGDPSLDAEHGLGADAWVRVNRGAFDAELAAYWNVMSGYIFPSSRGRVDIGPQGGLPRLQYTNEDARFVGAEGELTWRARSWLVAEASLSAVYAQFTSARDSIPIVSGADTTFVPPSPYPPLIPPLHGQVEIRYERPALFAGVGLRWAGDQDRLGDFETRTPGYAVAHVVAGGRWLVGGRLHQLTLRLDNAGDKAYRNHLSLVKDLVPEAGRGLSVLYRLSF